MKKILSMLLVLTMIMLLMFTFSGCGSDEPAADEGGQPGSQQQEQQGADVPDSGEEEPDTSGSEEAADSGTSGSTGVLHELFDIEQLADIPEFPDYAKKAIGDLRWCDDLGGDSFGKYHFNAYMKEVTQEDFETYIANLAANEPNDPIEGEEFYYYWDWGQITGTYFPDTGTLDVVLTAR